MFIHWVREPGKVWTGPLSSQAGPWIRDRPSRKRPVPFGLKLGSLLSPGTVEQRVSPATPPPAPGPQGYPSPCASDVTDSTAATVWSLVCFYRQL